MQLNYSNVFHNLVLSHIVELVIALVLVNVFTNLYKRILAIISMRNKHYIFQWDVLFSIDNATLLSCDMARKVLVRSTDIIVESGIDPNVLARKLYAKEIMSDNVYNRVRDTTSRDSNEERLEAILHDLRSRVENDASIMMKFVDILRVDLKRQDLADKILSN